MQLSGNSKTNDSPEENLPSENTTIAAKSYAFKSRKNIIPGKKFSIQTWPIR